MNDLSESAFSTVLGLCEKHFPNVAVGEQDGTIVVYSFVTWKTAANMGLPAAVNGIPVRLQQV